MGVRVPLGATFFLRKLSRPKTGSNHPPSQGVTGVHSPRVNRQMREADHSPTPSNEKNKVWSYSPNPMCLQRANRYSFTSTLPKMWNTVDPYSEVLKTVANPVLVTN